MSTQSEIVIIGGQEYQIGKLPARVGVQVAARIMNVIAPAIHAMPVEGFKPRTAEEMAKLLQPLLAQPELGGTLEYLCNTFAERTFLVGVHPHGHAQAGAPYQIQLTKVFDEHFSDKYDDLVLWLGHAMRVSMTSFFRGVSGLGALFPTKAAGASPSPG